MPIDPLVYRLLELSHKHRLSHIGSCVSAVGVLDRVYAQRKPGDPVVLGCGHAGLALYVTLEKWCGQDAEALLARHGIHATRDEAAGIYVSSGSLGQAETVAMGMALADRARDVWLVSSDGGMIEGAVWETLQYKARAKVANLRWFINANGYAAYHAVDVDQLERGVHAWCPDVEVVRTGFARIPFLQGLAAHYTTLSEADWAWVQANALGTGVRSAEQTV